MRGDEGRWCGAPWATRRTLAFILNKIEPQWALSRRQRSSDSGVHRVPMAASEGAEGSREEATGVDGAGAVMIGEGGRFWVDFEYGAPRIY